MKIILTFITLTLSLLLAGKTFASSNSLEKDLKLNIHGQLDISLAELFPDAYDCSHKKISYIIVAANGNLHSATDLLITNGSVVASERIPAGLLDYTYLQTPAQGPWSTLENSKVEFKGDLFVDSLSVVFE